MKLLNFDFRKAHDAIELNGLDLIWDLHNVLAFRGFDFDASCGELQLTWEGPPNSVVIGGVVTDNPFGYGGCELVFRGVQHVRLTSAAAAHPEAATTLHAMSKVRPGDGDYRFRLDRNPDDDLHLVFEFLSGLQVEIGAQEAELVGIAQAAP